MDFELLKQLLGLGEVGGEVREALEPPSVIDVVLGSGEKWRGTARSAVIIALEDSQVQVNYGNIITLSQGDVLTLNIPLEFIAVNSGRVRLVAAKTKGITYSKPYVPEPPRRIYDINIPFAANYSMSDKSASCVRLNVQGNLHLMGSSRLYVLSDLTLHGSITVTDSSVLEVGVCPSCA